MKINKSNGHSIEPCGTRLKTASQSETFPLRHILFASYL